MNRDDLKQLSLIRLEEAKVLLKNKNYEGAYYLCGYIIECGLKACIAKKTKKYDFPNLEAVKKSYTHNLTELIKIAGLNIGLDKDMKSNPKLGTNWSIVKDWSETSRYEKHTEKEARDLVYAVVNKKDGVLQWIKQHW